MFGIGELIKVHFTITLRTLRQNKSAKGPRLRQKLTREPCVLWVWERELCADREGRRRKANWIILERTKTCFDCNFIFSRVLLQTGFCVPSTFMSFGAKTFPWLGLPRILEFYLVWPNTEVKAIWIVYNPTKDVVHRIWPKLWITLPKDQNHVCTHFHSSDK